MTDDLKDLDDVEAACWSRVYAAVGAVRRPQDYADDAVRELRKRRTDEPFAVAAERLVHELQRASHMDLLDGQARFGRARLAAAAPDLARALLLAVRYLDDPSAFYGTEDGKQAALVIDEALQKAGVI